MMAPNGIRCRACAIIRARERSREYHAATYVKTVRSKESYMSNPPWKRPEREHAEQRMARRLVESPLDIIRRWQREG